MVGVSLNKLCLRYFRCFKQFDLEGIDQPVAIIGQNGTGKTTILEAISLLSPGRGIRSAPSKSIHTVNTEGQWKVSAELTTGETERLWVDTYCDPGQTRRVSLCDKGIQQVKLNEVIKILWISPAMDRIWNDSPESRRKFLDRIAMSLFPDHPTQANRYLKALKERNLLLRDQVINNSWYNSLEERMAEYGSVLTQNRLQTLEYITDSLLRSQQEVVPALKLIHPEPRNQPIISASKEILMELWQAMRAKEIQARRTLDGPHRMDLEVIYTKKGMPAKLCSTGEQKILLLAIVMAAARVLKHQLGMPPILLFDEFVAHLDQANRKLLVDEIKHMQLQVWMTSTETEVFRKLAQDFVIFEAPKFTLNLS